MRFQAHRQACPSAQPPAFPDATTKKVSAGYTILQLRITPSLTTGDEASFLQRVFSSDRGLTPHTCLRLSSLLWMSSRRHFTGKGLYHIDVFGRAQGPLRRETPSSAMTSSKFVCARAGHGC